MFNKKILAAAVASVISVGAQAAVNLDDADDAIKFASELITASDLNGDNLTVQNTVGGLLNIENALGFSLGNGTTKYVRINLTNAVFTTDEPTLTVNSTSSNTVVKSQGGNEGQDYVIFEVAATGDIPNDALVSLQAGSYDISQTAAANASYAFYENAGDSTSQTNPLSTVSGDFAEVTSGATGDFTTANEVTATVLSGFKEYETTPGYVTSNTVASLATIDTTDYVDADGTYTPAGAAADNADFLTTSQSVKIEGDFSFGTFTLDDAGTCNGTTTALTLNAEENEATSVAVDVTTAPLYLCASIDGTSDVVQKDSYTITLVTDEVEDEGGSFVYDTTSIEVPYLTTYSDYNQRVYLINTGANPSAYTIGTFTSEDGITATAGTAASGTIPAGEMLVLKARDIVSLSGGKTRTSAVIEVEAIDADISATTQVVNMEDSSTDTVVLN